MGGAVATIDSACYVFIDLMFMLRLCYSPNIFTDRYNSLRTKVGLKLTIDILMIDTSTKSVSYKP